MIPSSQTSRNWLRAGWSVVERPTAFITGLLAVIVLLAIMTGLPWALVHFIGWPLPNHLPTWNEIQATLTNPMSPRFLLDAISVLCWISWSAFVASVLRCLCDVVRGRRTAGLRRPGPLHALAAALISTIVLTLLGNRFPQAEASMATPSVPELVASQPPAAEQPDTAVTVRRPTPPGTIRVTEEVRAPRDGVHDSLWRVAQRIYGPAGGNRWPQLFRINRGNEQPNGGTLTNPNLVKPGWRITAYLPTPRSQPAPGDQQPPRPHPLGPHPLGPHPLGPHRPQPYQPPRSTTPPPMPGKTDTADNSQAGSGLDLSPGVFVSMSLAAAITAAVVTARMRRRRRYRIGSGDRADLHPVAPVVRALQVAYDRRTTHEASVGDHTNDASGTTAGGASDVKDAPVLASTTLGMRAGDDFALTLAGNGGLGLAGPGATPAARALLLHLLAGHQASCIHVFVPADDLPLVLDNAPTDGLPRAVHVVASLDVALDEMEAALLTRARHATEHGASPADRFPLVLLARPKPSSERRALGLLENGAPHGLGGVFLGQWSSGATLYVRRDGTVGATNPGPHKALVTTRLFTLPATQAADLLAVLRDAEEPADDPPPTPGDQTEPQPPRRPASQTPPEATGPPEPERLDDGAHTGDQPRPSRRLLVSVLGHVHLTDHIGTDGRELTGALRPKQREVLVYLALHPHGVRRDALNEAVWPGSRPPRPYNAFHNTVSTLRRALTNATNGEVGNPILNNDGRYKLNHDSINVDLWHLQDALNALHQVGTNAAAPLQHAITLYHGDLAEDLSVPWIEPFRESIRRDVLDALGAQIRAHRDTDPATTLILLERTRRFDPHNEVVYREIIRTQAALGDDAGISRTLSLLSATLEEINERPSVDTLNLVERLHRREPIRREGLARDAAAS